MLAAASTEQSLALLHRLSQAPDLSLFKEEAERVKQTQEVYEGAADVAVVPLTPAAAHGLRPVHLLLLVDLPNQALECIISLFDTIYGCCRILDSSSLRMQGEQQQQQQQEEIASSLQATGELKQQDLQDGKPHRDVDVVG
jgi:hypothetical protein